MTTHRNFDTFMELVDEALERLAMVSHLDIPDYDYHTDFDNGARPLNTARRALKAAGGF